MTRKQCLRLLKEMRSIYFENEQDKFELLENMKPAILKLQNGKDLFKQTTEYVSTDEFDKVRKLLRKAFQKERFWPFSSIRFRDLGAFIWPAIGLAVIGTAVIIVGYRVTHMAEQSASWPKTIGSIIDSRITEYEDSDGDISYQAQIQFRYIVSGKDYTSDKLGIGARTNFYMIGEAEQIVQRYPKDAQVTVYYDPEKHTRAVLEPGIDGMHFSAYLGFGTVSLAFLMFLISLTRALVKIVRTEKRKVSLNNKH